ncbi:hypothetical protein MKEN_00492900 [Mycena kentingensis (nom. inval.)]|nr:hypothetical protein MKEN_00492900 [Mycena kentingensis (nom. inval.)]
MQFSIVSALIVSFLALAASAAPLPEPAPAPVRLMQDRTVVEPAPLVGIDNVARDPEPQPQPLPIIESEEARGCRMYSCIWCVLLTTFRVRSSNASTD